MDESSTVIVLRVTRPDTILIRATSPVLQSMVATYLVLEGIECEPGCEQDIIDWVELHADAERLKLITRDWIRDCYGRLLGDLSDIQTGETLSQYLVDRKVATLKPHHYMDVIYGLINAKEPEND